ncbi:MAG: T9SS type A sorting domain-containing protein [Saprospiraceae bacterium]|nr:T9SS type A sorting domain-containing protein [Saprospiraceae bacterium]
MLRSNTLILTTLLFIGTIIWIGSSGGPGAVQSADRTGGPVSDGFCSQCHNGGSFGTDVQVFLTDVNGDTISEYVPETAYTLKVTVIGEGAARFGFQSVALDGSNDGTGNYGAPEDGSQISSVSGRDYFEHSAPSTSGEWEIEWTAPGAGTGSVTFYAAGNAVNANFDISGDQPDTTAVTIVESQTSSLADRQLADIQLQLSPNPAQEYISILWSNDLANPHSLRIVNVAGQILVEREISGVDQVISQTLTDYPSGIYMVQIQAQEGFQSKRFVKL